MVESNRPVLLLRGLDKWEPTYRIFSGKFNSPGFDQALIKALHEGVMRYEESMKKDQR